MENKLFNDFEELLSGIDDFKKNIQISNKLFDILNDLVTKIDISNKSLDDNYDSFLTEIKSANENIVKISENIAQKSLQVITEQKNEFDERYESFLKELSQANSNINTQSENVISTYIEVNKQQQEIFEKKTNGIIDRINNIDIESLFKEIKKLNARIILLFGGIGVAIIVGVTALFIR
jgi:hypothetical protein